MNNDGEIERYECSFGGYVFSALNVFNAFINNKTDTLKFKDEDIEYLDNMIKVNEKWKEDFVELSEALSNLDTKDAEARNELLDKFKYFAPAFFHGESMDEIKESYEKQNGLFIPNQYIENIGRVFIMDDWYEKYILFDGSWLFVLDLQEVLTNYSIHPQRCHDCGDFFLTDSKKNKYCPDCNKPENKNKRYYRNIKNDPIKKEKRNVLRLLDYYGLDTWRFNEEFDYYMDRVKGKPIKINPEYDSDIKTPEDIVKWLEEKHKGLLGYNKRRAKDDKTNEKG